jgi:putative transposase
MVNYRRARIPGATYFFTVTLRDRRKEWLIAYVDQLRAAVRDTRRQRPFTLEAIVVLPDHLHALWTLPEGDADFSGRWRAIKAGFTRALAGHGMTLVRDRGGEEGIWQRSSW